MLHLGVNHAPRGASDIPRDFAARGSEYASRLTSSGLLQSTYAGPTSQPQIKNRQQSRRRTSTKSYRNDYGFYLH